MSLLKKLTAPLARAVRAARRRRYVASVLAVPRACDNDCGGRGWRASHRSDDDRYAVERCDGCSWHGEGSPRTLFDDECVPAARRAGLLVRAGYPCYILSPCCRAPIEAHRVSPGGPWTMPACEACGGRVCSPLAAFLE